MNTKGIYTEDQLHDAESVAKVLAKVPEGKRGIVLMMVDAFVNGMAAQENICCHIRQRTHGYCATSPAGQIQQRTGNPRQQVRGLRRHDQG